MRVIVAMSPASTGGQLQRQIQLVRLIQRKLFVDIQSLAFLEHHKPAVAVQYFDRDLLELVILCAVLACMRVADFHEHKCFRSFPDNCFQRRHDLRFPHLHWHFQMRSLAWFKTPIDKSSILGVRCLIENFVLELDKNWKRL